MNFVKSVLAALRFRFMFAVPVFMTLFSKSANAGRREAIDNLLVALKPIFEVLSILAFVGAGFIIAGWAWGFIAAGEVKFDDVKKKGMGMIIGFILLFAIGAILRFLVGVAGGNDLVQDADFGF